MKKAYADLRKSIARDEKNPYVYRTLGILALKQEDYKDGHTVIFEKCF